MLDKYSQIHYPFTYGASLIWLTVSVEDFTLTVDEDEDEIAYYDEDDNEIDPDGLVGLANVSYAIVNGETYTDVTTDGVIYAGKSEFFKQGKTFAGVSKADVLTGSKEYIFGKFEPRSYKLINNPETEEAPATNGGKIVYIEAPNSSQETDNGAYIHSGKILKNITPQETPMSLTNEDNFEYEVNPVNCINLRENIILAGHYTAIPVGAYYVIDNQVTWL